MLLDPSHCPGIARIEALGKGGLSLGVYAVLAVLYAVVGRQMLASVGEPYATAMNQQLRIEATLMLSDGLETRNIIQLQGGLTKAAELPTFNETLFADGRSLLGGLRQRMEALTAAVEAAEPEALGQALERSIELHADGRPYVDRYHLRLAAKKLNAIVQALTLTLTLTLTLALALTPTLALTLTLALALTLTLALTRSLTLTLTRRRTQRWPRPWRRRRQRRPRRRRRRPGQRRRASSRCSSA